MITNKLTLKQLETFDCVVKWGTFRKAAQAMGTTQPNISARINGLEESLGVLLMHRDAGSIRLTEKGKALLVAARKVLAATQEFVETAQRQDLIEDRLRLGVTELVASTWLHAFLRQFRTVYPGIFVELDVNLSVEVERNFKEGQVDLAIMTGAKSGISKSSLSLGTYDYTWVCTPDLAGEMGAEITLKTLLEASIITHAKHTVASRALANLVRQEGLMADRIVHSTSLSACVEMVIDRMGVALLPAALVQKPIEQGKLVNVPFGWKPDSLDFVARFNEKTAPYHVQKAAHIACEIAKSYSQ